MPDDHRKSAPSPRRWSELRFAIIGPLLAAPPPRGELGQRLTELSRMTWRHPTTGAPVKFGASTIERWLGRARAEPRDRVAVLARRLRKDRGTQPTCTDHLCQVLRAQYRDHTGWTMKLHFDNLRALADKDPALHPLPSYSTVVRFMKAHDLVRRQTVGPRLSLGAQQAAHRLLACEVRSYEAEYTNQLWHSDYHTSKRTPVLLGNGRWKYPVCLCVMDDHSRLCCHVQWYLDEEAETFAHGLGQAFQKRGLPTGLMTDRGGPMAAAEIQDALHRRLGIPHEPTLPYSPYQNGKQESLWGQLEGRLMAMLEGVPDLTLAMLNQATQAWVEMEYNRAVHSEIGCAPAHRYLNSKDVSRPCPSSDELRLCFMQEETRMLRRSDGTVKLQNVRFEVPSAYRTLARPQLRWARWDLGRVYLVDPPTGKTLARLYPQDKLRNADGGRRALGPVVGAPAAEPPAAGIAPLLERLMADYAREGLAPAYLPKEGKNKDKDKAR